ncbi:D-dopachrome decarboxylase-B-like [Gastrophryne carolinensis]
MPVIEVDTNIPQHDIPANFAEKLLLAAVSILGKPREMLNVTLRSGLPMIVNGSSAPCAQVVVSAIEIVETAEQNKEYSSKFFAFLTKELKLGQDRLQHKVPSSTGTTILHNGPSNMQENSKP